MSQIGKFPAKTQNSNWKEGFFMADGKADKAKGAGGMAKGVAKEKTGEITKNDKMKREGKSDKVKGKAREKTGDVKENL
ncbi:CsbD-like [Alkalicoccus daliensis]|uniref:CsbD-like n=2 Tax=Alkalicoccus daliensis TaxID=745820 RepID=A0A1H0E8D3_9BACI|nr:CsbD-like [Alkalicoccus daliensis]